MKRRTGLAVATIVALAGARADALEEPSPQADRTTYAIEYVVRISAERPTIARVRWNLAGIEEIRRFRIHIDDERIRDVEGSGEIERNDDEIVWRPSGPYAHLDYKVRLRHRRGEDERYDSYATKSWVITRAQDLFPRTHVTFDLDVEREPRSRSTLRILLPTGWQSYTAMEPLGTNTFRPFVRGRRLDRPKGWMAFGRLEKSTRDIAGVHVVAVTPPDSAFPAKAVLDLYELTLPTLVDLLHAPIPRLLIVSAPDPMWHGGLSGESSFYLHAERPIRTPDETSPALHEAFHVLASFRPAKDARWLSEGLAEYYSLVLQHRAGAIGRDQLRRGLLLWRRYAKWDTNITAKHDLALTNNAAPFVLSALDEWIHEKSESKLGLDDVVRDLTRSREPLTTARFLQSAKRVTGQDVTPFVQRHVFQGARPELRVLADAAEGAASE